MRKGASGIPAILLGMVAIGAAAPCMAQTQQWWGCPAGYEFEVRPDRPQMRCIKHPETRYRPVGCPALGEAAAGLELKVVADGKDDEDVCMIGESGYTARPGCARGYRMEIRKGADRCALHVPGSVVAPEKL